MVTFTFLPRIKIPPKFRNNAIRIALGFSSWHFVIKNYISTIYAWWWCKNAWWLSCLIKLHHLKRFPISLHQDHSSPKLWLAHLQYLTVANDVYHAWRDHKRPSIFRYLLQKLSLVKTFWHRPRFTKLRDLLPTWSYSLSLFRNNTLLYYFLVIWVQK